MAVKPGVFVVVAALFCFYCVADGEPHKDIDQYTKKKKSLKVVHMENLHIW